MAREFKKLSEVYTLEAISDGTTVLVVEDGEVKQTTVDDVVGVDSTLSIEGKPADAKATGDAISVINTTIVQHDESITTLSEEIADKASHATVDALAEEIANKGNPTDEQVGAAVNAYLAANPVEATPIDATLSASGEAADAKLTGAVFEHTGARYSISAGWRNINYTGGNYINSELTLFLDREEAEKYSIVIAPDGYKVLLGGDKRAKWNGSEWSTMAATSYMKKIYLANVDMSAYSTIGFTLIADDTSDIALSVGADVVFIGEASNVEAQNGLKAAENNMNCTTGKSLLEYGSADHSYEIVGYFSNAGYLCVGFSGATSAEKLYVLVPYGTTLTNASSYSDDKYITGQFTNDSNRVFVSAVFEGTKGDHDIYSYEIPAGKTNIGVTFLTDELDDNSLFIFSDAFPTMWIDREANVIDCWGDSLTQSVNSAQKTYPQMLAEFLHVRTNNFGVGGESGLDIAGRQGGCPLYIAADVTIPASGSVDIVLKSTYNDFELIPSRFLVQNDVGLNPCCIAGVVGRIASDGTKINFTRAEAGDAVNVKQYELVYPRWGENTNNHAQVIFAGNNLNGSLENETEIFDVIDRMIAYYNNKNYLVISILYRTDINEVIALEHQFKQRYGNKCFCVREYLNRFGIAKAIEYGLIESATDQDEDDIANELVPTSLKLEDEVHLNYNGYYVMAKRVAELLAYNKCVL